jgi:hypothetical protein
LQKDEHLSGKVQDGVLKLSFIYELSDKRIKVVMMLPDNIEKISTQRKENEIFFFVYRSYDMKLTISFQERIESLNR